MFNSDFKGIEFDAFKMNRVQTALHLLPKNGLIRQTLKASYQSRAGMAVLLPIGILLLNLLLGLVQNSSFTSSKSFNG
tara:strand:+ start:238 stop:471 length:234 start_codon:yes stop_codon:yes gene_type:complete